MRVERAIKLAIAIPLPGADTSSSDASTQVLFASHKRKVFDGEQDGLAQLIHSAASDALAAIRTNNVFRRLLSSSRTQNAATLLQWFSSQGRRDVFSQEIADGSSLRPLDPWNAEEFAAHLNRAREHIRPWVGPTFVTDTVDGARATLRRYADATAADGARIFGIWHHGTLVGGVMFVSFDAAWGVCEIGCWLEPEAQGNGLITRAVAALLDWAFITRGVVRAEWRCRTDNDRSVAVAHRLGMQSEGILRSSWLYDGKRYDKQVFSLLNTEWPNLGNPEVTVG